MNDKITRHQIIARLEENDILYGLLPLQNDVSIVISQRGGRIFGPFLSPDDEGIFWMNRAFARPDSFKEFLESGSWNLGGSRIWIAPEIQYGVRDRSNFWGSVFWPPQVDPGNYVLEQPQPGRYRLSQDITLEAYNLASGRKELHLERVIRQAEDPLRNLSAYEDLIAGVLFAGYEQIVSLSESTLDDIMSEAWNLVQLNPGGVLVIPASPGVEFVDYYAPVGDLQAIHADHVRLQLTGRQQYKVGYKAAHVFGRMGYFNHLDDGRAYLVLRNFFNNPSVPYAEEPDHTPGCRGHSIHVYNDGGEFGGFAEMECNLQTIGGETGRSASTDQMLLWLYVGAEEKVKTIALHLLGIEI
ncbi:MAG: hypothetical protein H8D78_20475 [Chloroflexi bacterium]|nr:hypothetical protein [Chloroflexota bacterium]